jgi:hypothetical protein
VKRRKRARRRFGNTGLHSDCFCGGIVRHDLVLLLSECLHDVALKRVLGRMGMCNRSSRAIRNGARARGVWCDGCGSDGFRTTALPMCRVFRRHGVSGSLTPGVCVALGS